MLLKIRTTTKGPKEQPKDGLVTQISKHFEITTVTM